MNFRVFILAISVISVGLVELIVGGILPTIADDLSVSIGQAGQLITVFALVYALSGPILYTLTANMERKKLLLLTLGIFVLGNVITYISPSFLFVMIARVLTAMSTALIIVLSLTIAAKIVQPQHRAKAIGLIYMGISSSLVLGVPIGIIVSDAFGWRMLFLFIGLMALLSMVLIAFTLERIEVEQVQSLKSQLKALRNKKMLTAHLTMLFMLAGHYTIYAYFTPFLESELGLNTQWISICYFIFGIAAVGGGAFGGSLADRFGSKVSIILVVASFAVILFALPFSTVSFPLFIVGMVIWAALSWSLAPPLQNYIVETDSESAGIHQSFNNSALQIGISLGSLVGGIVNGATHSMQTTAHVGSLLVIISLAFGVWSLRSTVRKAVQN
ncbi:MFS transporter, DHA1 family, purine base/nucleoside efflux pump [Terribacillus aidingensis]|uniref:MFS transporter, DHA1 family, purine base/nucleoside efflux pump n=1 Tax=Terribacillus aidingensis TaxID=586416 RepID=A0A285P8I0_9BACI|nr:MFS transporter [Terribacillus aidingensis]SNZ17513.1 MFS transporter, DHA1 family, purine base/nucleoside efflux pump [Terribacillus aidingensis]